MANRLVGRFRKGQVSLEMAVALISVFILLLGTLNLFIWLNKRFILRQRDYEYNPERGRVAAGNTTNAAEIQVNETGYLRLNILGEK
jgi:hypothetical protein